MAHKLLIPVLAGGTAAALVAGAGVAVALHKNDVTVVVDGVAKTIGVREDTVSQVLQLEGIAVGEHDVLLPAADTSITDGMEITVNYARPLELVVDGKKRDVWTTAQNVDEALSLLNLNEHDAKLSASRSTSIGRDGLSLQIATAKDVALTAGGKTSKVTQAGTVADVLKKSGIRPDADDKVTPAATTKLSDGMRITVVNVQVKQSTKLVPVAFQKETVKSDKLAKGEEKVTTKGVAGALRDTYTDVYHDGKLVSSTRKARVNSKSPVTEVTTVGTKEEEPQVEEKAEDKTEDKTEKKDSGKRKSADQAGDEKPTKKAAVSESKSLSPASGSTCKASYYWEPQPTASGERFDTNAMTAAHKSLPMHSRVKVTNLANGKTVVVRINDRGPYIAGRCLDLSTAAMQQLGGVSSGVIKVAYDVVG